MAKTKAKKKKHVYPSFYEDGIRYMLCSNSIEGGLGPNYWTGQLCNHYQRAVSKDAPAVVCWKCTNKLVGPPDIKYGYQSTGRPRGWQFMKEFVDKDGTVFHKGKEQPKLKGTLPVTEIKPKEGSKKLSKKEKEKLRMQILQQMSFLRGELKTAKFKKDINSSNVKMRKLERDLKKL